MPITARQKRGRVTQVMAAKWFQGRGFPHARAVLNGAAGRDLIGMARMAPEVKATSDDPNPAALRQAKKNADPGDLAFVIWRPNGYGESDIADWPVSMTLAQFTQLVLAAGYGEPPAGGGGGA